MSDTYTQLYYKVLKQRGHWKPRIWTFYILFLFTVMVVEARGEDTSNEWPTYQHPTSSSQECYMCPPGFYKVRDCAPTRDKSVQWSMCLPCPDSQYSQRWNTDGRCWDSDSCEKDHVVVYDGGNIGPKTCACNGSSLEDENGVCVDGITSLKHHAVLNRHRVSCDAKVKAATKVVMVTPVKSTATQRPCTTAETTEASCPECAVCEGFDVSSIPLLTLVLGVLLGWPFGIITGIFIYKCRKTKQGRENNNNRMNESEKKKSSVKNGEVPKSDRQSVPLQKQGHESVSSQQDSDSKDSEDSDVDGRKIPNGITKTQTVILIPPPEAQEGKQKSRSNSRVDEEVSKPGGTDVVGHSNGEKEKEEKATPAVSEEQQQRQLPDDALRIMEKEVTTRDEADSIIRHVLGLSAKQCTSILDKNATSAGVLRDGFQRWEERKGGKKATVENLVSALLKHDHRMMAEKINAELKLNLELEQEHDEIDEFDNVIKICEEILVVDDRVVEFFRSYLELGDKVTNADRKILIREGLQKWQARNGKSATAEKLIQHFIDASMQNEADEIRKELKRRNLGAIGGSSTSEPAENMSKAVPIRGATGADGYSELSAGHSRPRSSRSSDIQGTPHSTSRPERRSVDNGGSSHEVLHGSRNDRRVDSPRTFPSPPSSFPPSQGTRVGNPTAGIDVESGTRRELPSTGSSSASLQQQQGDLVSECERVKYDDNSRPIEHVDLEDECSGHGGKDAPHDDTQYHDKGDTKALKPGKDKPKELKSDTKPKENDPLLENHENEKKRKKKRSKTREAY